MANAFSEEALRAHNAYRERHSAPALKLSPQLCKSAQEWAETLLTKPSLENSPVANNGDVGENISMRRGTGSVDINGTDVSAQWYNDVSKYDFRDASGDAGNFTQVVWISTTEVGFGKARTPDGNKCIVVAHYSPPGNVIDDYERNVKPPIHGDKHQDKDKDKPQVGKDKTGEKSEASKPEEKKARVTVTVERASSPSGRQFVVRRSVKEVETPDGKVERKVSEIEFKDEQAARDYEKVAASDSESSEDEEAHVDISKTPEERRKLHELSSFRRQVRKVHNQYRKLHNAARLKRNKEMDAAAQKWAEHLLQQPSLANSSSMYKGVRVGENIASRRSNAPCDYGAQDVVDHWYNEHRKYDFSVEPRDVQGIGNFTQTVWKNTKELGVGKAIHTEANGATRVIVVCHYYPAGNVLTQFMENVHKQK